MNMDCYKDGWERMRSMKQKGHSTGFLAECLLRMAKEKNCNLFDNGNITLNDSEEIDNKELERLKENGNNISISSSA